MTNLNDLLAPVSEHATRKREGIYPWDTLLDGNVRRFDADVLAALKSEATVSSFANSFRQEAAKRGLPATIITADFTGSGDDKVITAVTASVTLPEPEADEAGDEGEAVEADAPADEDGE